MLNRGLDFYCGLLYNVELHSEKPGGLNVDPTRKGNSRTMTLEGRNRWFALYVLCLGTLMIVLDVTIVNVALPSIRVDLGFSEASLAWVVNAYLLTFGGYAKPSSNSNANATRFFYANPRIP